jgi:hypothetical protein
VIRIDFLSPIAPDLELEQVTQVVCGRLYERLEGDRMLASLGHGGEVDVVGRPVGVEPQRQRNPALDHPPLRLRIENAGQEATVGNLTQSPTTQLLRMARAGLGCNA